MLDNPLSAAPVVDTTRPAHAPGPEPLTGKHMRLERLKKEHFPDLYENVGSHADLWTWWPEGPYNTAPEFYDSMNGLLTFLKDDLAVYAIFLLSGPFEGKAVGLAFALSEDRESNRVGEIGLFLGPPIQRTRAGTEMVYIISNLLFELNHRRVGWKTNALNAPSRKAAERLGFVYEGTFRQHQINKGRNRDSVFYSIIDSEWPTCKKAFEMWLEDGNFDEQGRQRRKLEAIRESLKDVAQ